MHVLPIIIIFFLGGMIIAACAWAPFSSPRLSGWRRAALSAGSGLAVVGAAGFFGSALSTAGGLNWLPGSVEWPAGYVQGVVSTPSGLFVAPLTHCGRIQVYDADWKFIRGWYVDAGGGTFKLRPAGPDRIEVFVVRGQWRYVFDERGTLILKTTYAPASYESFECAGHAVVVPTAMWLWVFAHPAISWVALFAGLVIVGASSKMSAKKRES